MDALEHLQQYTTSQKWAGTNFIILGIVLLVLFLVIMYLGPRSDLSNGLKWTSLVAGLLMVINGFVYRNFCDTVYKNGSMVYERDYQEFVTSEFERMSKVDSGFIYYQLFGGTMILASIIIIVFIDNQILKGVAFGLSILFIGFLLVEAYSHQSISEYFKNLKQLHGQYISN